MRELERFAERFALGLEDARLPHGPERGGLSLAERVAEFDADLIRDTLSLTRGDAQESMRRLKLARKTFYDRLARHGIAISAYRPRKTVDPAALDSPTRALPRSNGSAVDLVRSTRDEDRS